MYNNFFGLRQELLLSTISEKDAVIGSLEFDRSSDSKENKRRIHQLNEEKDYLHQQLKELVRIFKLFRTKFEFKLKQINN